MDLENPLVVFPVFRVKNKFHIHGFSRFIGAEGSNKIHVGFQAKIREGNFFFFQTLFLVLGSWKHCILFRFKNKKNYVYFCRQNDSSQSDVLVCTKRNRSFRCTRKKSFSPSMEYCHRNDDDDHHHHHRLHNIITIIVATIVSKYYLYVIKQI